MGQVAQQRARAFRVAGTVVLSLLSGASLAAAVGLALAARFVMCGISGCSGGGFGRVTDPPLTLTLIVAAGVALALPVVLYAVWRRRARLALAAVPAAALGTILVGLVIGADWNGCPRTISTATCQEERGH
ncbi:hypothetical protein P0Y31_04645 [Knoellia sp. 3-2P3]|uniref:hypothetical protein n=1 Tax=unclassified Knoellia TaxID=2618719 RepID=UPI0023DB5256|nr:hypothetical protein [Knoellia sp. 3-2P3]MDF2091621.1 hypothetical protein [Knoellia sp. 3-2P3]